MKIFFLASSFPDNDNPMRGVFNLRFVKQMKELGEEVTVVFFRIWSPGRKVCSSYSYRGIEVTQVCLPLAPWSGYFFSKINIFICRTLGWILLKKKLVLAEVIHSVYLTSNGIAAGYWSRKAHVPHIAQAIGTDVNSDMVLMGRKSSNWMKNIDGIITNSYELEATLKKYCDEKPKIKTIYRGTYIDELPADDQKANRGVSFLYMGGLGNKTFQFGMNTKGGITLMKAWEKVEKDLHSLDASLYFGGPGSDTNVSVKWKNSLTYPERVHLIGKVHPRDVKSYLHNADVVVVPSMQEGLPNFLMESYATSTPAIGSNAGGIPEVIVDKETGYIFEKGNVEQLKELLLKSASHPQKNKLMGRKAYERVKASFNSRLYSQKVLHFYKKIIQECAGSRD